tara:strand:+ start:9096 stop:10382 length:1287 start_codon:yes stop_codon:yes gene_type:complete
MKLIKIFYLFILTFLLGCSTSSDNNTNTQLPFGPEYILLSSDKSILEIGETVSMTVIDDEDVDITAQSTIFIDDTPIVGSTFTPSLAGSYQIKATYQSVTSNKIYVTADMPVVLSRIDVILSEPAIFLGGTVTFSAFAIYSDNTSVEITSESEFYVDDMLISGTEFTGAQVGSIEVKAVYQTISSGSFQVHIVDPSTLPSNFSKKAVIEDFTGTWCGWCPRVSYAASLVEEQTDKVFTVGIHNGDQMANSFGSTLENFYNVGGWPTAYIDRASLWNYPEPNNISQALEAAEGTVNIGLAIESSLNGSNLDMTIYQGFLQNMTNVKLLVFILENGIITNQSNYTGYYGGSSTLTDFEHNGVLRYVATDIMGDLTTSTLGIHERSFSVNLSSYGVLDLSKIGILAMLVNDSARVLYNAQYASPNETKDFD